MFVIRHLERLLNVDKMFSFDVIQFYFISWQIASVHSKYGSKFRGVDRKQNITQLSFANAHLVDDPFARKNVFCKKNFKNDSSALQLLLTLDAPVVRNTPEAFICAVVKVANIEEEKAAFESPACNTSSTAPVACKFTSPSFLSFFSHFSSLLPSLLPIVSLSNQTA